MMLQALPPIVPTVPAAASMQPGAPMSVAVITFCFESARTIVDALRSVQAQTHPALEHIVIDGASLDATAQLVHEHDRRVARFVSEPDRGIYYSMNQGLALASGEFVGFLNADDMFADDDVVARISAAAFALSRPNAVLRDFVYVDAVDLSRVVEPRRSAHTAPQRCRRTVHAQLKEPAQAAATMAPRLKSRFPIQRPKPESPP